MKTMYVSLSPKSSRGKNTLSITQAIQELEKYRDSLVDKNALFIKRLAEIGVTAAESRLASGQGDSSRDARFSVVFNTSEGLAEGQIIITSTPKIDEQGRKFYPHLAWEFGAGIYFNNGNANPKASEFGLGVGTFPDQIHAYRDYWWYKDEAGNLHLSQGTQATMPMYNASRVIIEQIEVIAREIFSG